MARFHSAAPTCARSLIRSKSTTPKSEFTDGAQFWKGWLWAAGHLRQECPVLFGNGAPDGFEPVTSASEGRRCSFTIAYPNGIMFTNLL